MLQSAPNIVSSLVTKSVCLFLLTFTAFEASGPVMVAHEGHSRTVVSPCVVLEIALYSIYSNQALYHLIYSHRVLAATHRSLELNSNQPIEIPTLPTAIHIGALPATRADLSTLSNSSSTTKKPYHPSESTMCIGTTVTFECGHKERINTHPCPWRGTDRCALIAWKYTANWAGFCTTCSSGRGHKKDEVHGDIPIKNDTKQPASK